MGRKKGKGKGGAGDASESKAGSSQQPDNLPEVNQQRPVAQAAAPQQVQRQAPINTSQAPVSGSSQQVQGQESFHGHQEQGHGQGQGRGRGHPGPGRDQGQGAGRGRGRGRGQPAVDAPAGGFESQRPGGARGAPPGASSPSGPPPSGPPFRGPPSRGPPPSGPPPSQRPGGPSPSGPPPTGPPSSGPPSRGPPPSGPPPSQNPFAAWGRPGGPSPSGPPPSGPPPSGPPPSGPPPSGPPPSGPPTRGPPSSKPPSSGPAPSGAQARPPPCRAVALPKRTDCAKGEKLGRPINLEVNHLLVKIADTQVNIHHYDVTIDPDKPKRLMRPVMIELQKKYYPRHNPGFDGRKNLYSNGPLPFGIEMSGEVNVADDERVDKAPKTFKVTVKLARDHLSVKDIFAYQERGRSTNPPQDVIQALDVILRSASSKSFVQVGRSFYCQPQRLIELSGGMELWLGFFQSLVMGHKPYLNIDVAHKGFPKRQSLLDLLFQMDTRARDPTEAMQRKKDEFEKFIRGLKIEYEIPNIPSSKRIYRVNGLKGTAISERFNLDDNRTMCIGEYFSKEKKYQVRYANLPCVHVGNREKNIIVPLELCTLLGGQATMKKLNEEQTRAMVKFAATNVEDRKRKIREAMRQANINASQEVKEFGLSVANDFTKVAGRILPAPSLRYQQQAPVKPNKGIWNGGRFLESRRLQKWIVVVTCRLDRDAVNQLTRGLKQESQRVGLDMDDCQPPIMMNSPPFRLRNELAQVLQKLQRENYQLVIVVISGFNKQVYGEVKQVAEIQVGILTQCVKDSTVQRRCNAATMHNILLKINAKFNGTNHVIANESKLACFNKKILVIGADVTHPSPDSKDIPSVAAVTASHDMAAFKYNMKIRLQPPRVEIIADLENIVKDQLSSYQQQTGGLPEHIIFYRDGVSEGQFQQVLNAELTAIQAACKTKNFKPMITFLVVQKRHHTRFFPMDSRDSQDRNGNVPAGTIVDTEITHPTEIDFYLVSHASIQGVARPTKYHVLWDDARMSEGEIQQLTYNLCHLFTRCDRAVSYPAPTYYAHLAASRGRVYLEGRQVNLDNLQNEARRITTSQNFCNVSPMYFV